MVLFLNHSPVPHGLIPGTEVNAEVSPEAGAKVNAKVRATNLILTDVDQAMLVLRTKPWTYCSAN